MPNVIFVQTDGSRQEIAIPNGLSVMEGALNAGVAGIDADCGGACACATCRVTIDAAWTDKVGQAGGNERDMLEFADDTAPDSRLSCQVTMRADLDGLVVHVPATQR